MHIMNKDNNLAVFAGGCFWCTEAVFQRVKGVDEVISGYTGGNVKNPAYREITTGRTGHAEAIMVKFDEEQIAYKELLEIFFATHNPTTLNQQGADIGTQYRSAIFYINNQQKKEAYDYIDYLNTVGYYNDPIVTQITKLDVFYNAEAYHQNYYNQNSAQGYCQFVINPKLSKLRANFAHKLKEK